MVYQEQIMRILNKLGRIPLSSSYTCIKAISKKKHDKIAKFNADFIKGAIILISVLVSALRTIKRMRTIPGKAGVQAS